MGLRPSQQARGDGLQREAKPRERGPVTNGDRAREVGQAQAQDSKAKSQHPLPPRIHTQTREL